MDKKCSLVFVSIYFCTLLCTTTTTTVHTEIFLTNILLLNNVVLVDTVGRIICCVKLLLLFKFNNFSHKKSYAPVSMFK